MNFVYEIENIFRGYRGFPWLSSYSNTSGSLGEREMLWEHESQAIAEFSQTFTSVSVIRYKHEENVFHFF